MARRAVRTLVIASIALGALLAIAAGFHVYESEPLDDMRRRADALPLPQDFVLVSESYSPGAMGLFGALPDLERVYHAPWPGLCDSLRGLGSRLGGPSGLAPVPRGYAGQMCNCGALHRSGWWGWIRNYRHYEVRLTAWRPGFARGPVWETPNGFLVLYPSYDQTSSPKIVIPKGRARVAVELIAHRGW
jgi:hypothetical protein